MEGELLLKIPQNDECDKQMELRARVEIIIGEQWLWYIMIVMMLLMMMVMTVITNYN